MENFLAQNLLRRYLNYIFSYLLLQKLSLGLGKLVQFDSLLDLYKEGSNIEEFLFP